MTNHEIKTLKVVESETIETEDEEIIALEDEEIKGPKDNNEAKGFVLPPPS